jgi:hypothetical protein
MSDHRASESGWWLYFPSWPSPYLSVAVSKLLLPHPCSFMLIHSHRPSTVLPRHPSPPHIRPSHVAWLDQSASPFPLIFSTKPRTWCRLPAAGPSGQTVTERYRICLASLVERRSPLPDLTVWSVLKAAPCDIRSKWQPIGRRKPGFVCLVNSTCR